MAHAVTLMMASLPCSILGSGTVSQRISPFPCQVSAFIEWFSALSMHEQTLNCETDSYSAGCIGTSQMCGHGLKSTKARIRRLQMPASGQFALVTGASTGIGLELARKCCARQGFDLSHLRR